MDSPASSATVTTSLRICQLDAWGLGAPAPAGASGWMDGLDAASGLGITHVLIPSPFLPGGRPERGLIADHDRLHPALGTGAPEAWLRQACEAATAAGLGLLMDVRVDRVAADGALADSQPTPFLALDRDAVLDPRRDLDVQASLAAAATPEQATALAAWWTQRLDGWHAAGVAGFRLLGLDGLPGDAVVPLLRALRQGCRALLLAWTPGVAWAALDGLGEIGLDGVFCSLPWWQGEGEWLWDELAHLRPLAPVIAPLALPAGSGSAMPPDRLAVAAVIGDGWLVGSQAQARDGQAGTLARLLDQERSPGGAIAVLSGSGGPVLAALRTDAPDLRVADRGVLVLANTDASAAHAVDPTVLLPAAGGRLDAFEPLLPRDGEPLVPGLSLTLAPGEVRLYAAGAAPAPDARRSLDVHAAEEAGHWGRLAIENPSPAVDDGTLPVKRIVGELVAVQVDVLCDGHDKLAVALQWRGPDEAAHETRMRPLGNDRYAAAFPLPALGRYRYRIEAWRDVFESFRDELGKKHAAGVPIELEMIEGTRLVEAAAARAEGGLQQALAASLAAMEAGPDARREALLSAELATAMAAADPRDGSVASERPIAVQAERVGARYASWYEVFPRSMSDDANRHGTFADVERHLPRVRDMGFDVLYFPPIHPIGTANRKGRNNTLTPGPEDVGSPYAIGSEEGGHDALHPQLGTLDDFRHLVAAAHGHGIEIAIDFAVQCSPDHPWLKEHRGWFDWRPDGSIKYAENPPKKYQDIVNVDFYAEDAVPGLWVALCDVVLFWAQQGVRLFRVDNPHTKPFPFWQWMIAEVQARFPDAIFLAEAFTRPKVMYRLAKVGFSQSYTYFTWRNTKAELEEYVTELADTAPRDFFRPHFFVNTPDINPPFLQTSGRPGLPDTRRTGGDAVGAVGRLQRLRAVRGDPVARARGVPRQREVRDTRLGLGAPRQHRARGHPPQPHTRRQPVPADAPGRDLPARRQRRGHGVREGDRGPLQRRACRHQHGPDRHARRGVRPAAVALEPARQRHGGGRRAGPRRAGHLDRTHPARTPDAGAALRHLARPPRLT